MSAWANLAPPLAFGADRGGGNEEGADGGSVVTVVGGSFPRRLLRERSAARGGETATEGLGTKGEGTLLTVPEEKVGTQSLLRANGRRTEGKEKD